MPSDPVSQPAQNEPAPGSQPAEKTAAGSIPVLGEWSWSAIKLTEVSALVSIVALACGYAYNAGFFYSLSPPMLQLLSINDQLKSAAWFLPTIIFASVVSWVAQLLMSERFRYKILAALVFHAFFPFPGLRLKTLQRIQPFVSLESQMTKAAPDRDAVTLFLMFMSPVSTLFLIICAFVFRGPWGAITVIFSLLWWTIHMILFLVISETKVTLLVLLATVTLPMFIGVSAINGYGDASSLSNTKLRRVVVQVTGRQPDDSSVLARVLDEGVLVYNQSERHLSDYPWTKVERLDVGVP